MHDVLASANAVVWSRGSDVAEHPSFAPHEILRSYPHLTVTAITPFGLEGPWRDKPATEFTLQAWSGAIIGLGRGAPTARRCSSAVRVGEWLAGLFAAIGTLASLRGAGGDGELVDVSMLEALAMCLTYYPVTFNDQLGRPMRKRRFVPTPGVGAARDGLVGLGVGTGQQWLDFCAMVGHPEWTEDPSLFLERTALGSDDRRVDRTAHRRRSARPRVRVSDPERTHRERRQRDDVRPLPYSGNVRRERRATAPSTRARRSDSPTRRSPNHERRRDTLQLRRFRSAGSVSWT